MPKSCDKACAVCVKRHEVPAATLGGGLVRLPPRLECRALPPRQDVAMHAIYPTVRPEDYCHLHFELDAEAKKAVDKAAAESSALDEKVAQTQAAAVAQPELALEPSADEPKPRARRARAETAES